MTIDRGKGSRNKGFLPSTDGPTCRGIGAPNMKTHFHSFLAQSADHLLVRGPSRKRLEGNSAEFCAMFFTSAISTESQSSAGSSHLVGSERSASFVCLWPFVRLAVFICVRVFGHICECVCGWESASIERRRSQGKWMTFLRSSAFCGAVEQKTRSRSRAVHRTSARLVAVHQSASERRRRRRTQAHLLWRKGDRNNSGIPAVNIVPSSRQLLCPSACAEAKANSERGTGGGATFECLF